MPYRQIATRRDPLWIACMRVAYAGLVRRAAERITMPCDERWLADALSALKLDRAEFARDVSELSAGQIPPCVAGKWPDELPIDLEDVIETEEARIHS